MLPSPEWRRSGVEKRIVNEMPHSSPVSPQPAARILVVDDDPSAQDAIRLVLEKGSGYPLRCTATSEEALSVIRSEPIELALVDLRLGSASGLDLLVELKKIRPEMSVMMITGAGTIEIAVEAMRLGADNFLTKPVAPKNLLALVAKGLENRSLRRRTDQLERLRIDAPAPNDLGRSPAMRRALDLVESVASRETTVLLTGETGSGKGLLARRIHDLSPRRRGAFVELNCAGLQRELVESELFGHEKGSFSGAIDRKIGLFEAADNGTLFLDEIGEMDPAVQAKLLKVLESRRFRRIGGVAEISVNVRVLVATNRDLSKDVEHGKFRRDLLFRLNVFEIPLPPLRDRDVDIENLANRFAEEFRGPGASLTEEAIERLRGYDWPGNVRELRNVVERAAILAPRGESIDVADLPPLRSRAAAAGSAEGDREPAANDGPELPTFREAERRFLDEALQAHGGNVRATARALGIARATLYRKIERYGLAVTTSDSD